jgi:hypothetical protein
MNERTVGERTQEPRSRSFVQSENAANLAYADWLVIVGDYLEGVQSLQQSAQHKMICLIRFGSSVAVFGTEGFT